jgi:hypothetical protein
MHDQACAAGTLQATGPSRPGQVLPIPGSTRHQARPGRIPFVSMAARPAAFMLAAHGAHSVAPAGPVYAALYETCAALIVAVMVVIYFDERVRHRMTLRVRGYAVGWLGGIIGTGLLIPLFALAGFIPDTVRIREITTGYTLVFLVVAFGIAMQIWGAEDGAQLRIAQPGAAPALPILTAPPPRPGQTEREHAAEVLAAGLAIIGQVSPPAVTAGLARTGPAAEAERLRQLTAQWITLQPTLLAIAAGYPSAQVREKVATLFCAAIKAMEQPAALFADKETLAGGQPAAGWQEQATPAFTAVQAAWDAVTEALHRDDPKPKATENGRRTRHPRATTGSGSTGKG